jgi:hypothetical protein
VRLLEKIFAKPAIARVAPFLVFLALTCCQDKFGAVWNPPRQFSGNSALAWLMIVTRIPGSTFIVPPLEEVFYRSFLYRCIARQKFLPVP